MDAGLDPFSDVVCEFEEAVTERLDLPVEYL